ncbi:MAG: VOC family protein, partial [Actinomycetes bacterium]
YLEVVGHLDHPAVDKAPFGQAVKLRSQAGGGWLGWVVAVDDISVVEQRLGRTAATGNRHRPDGFDLQWRQIGVLDLIGDPALPFFIEWDVAPEQHPSAGGGPCHITKLELHGDQGTLGGWLGQPGEAVLDGIDLEWVDGEEPGLVAVHVQTAHGVVRID